MIMTMFIIIILISVFFLSCCQIIEELQNREKWKSFLISPSRDFPHVNVITNTITSCNHDYIVSDHQIHLSIAAENHKSQSHHTAQPLYYSLLQNLGCVELYERFLAETATTMLCYSHYLCFPVHWWKVKKSGVILIRPSNKNKLCVWNDFFFFYSDYVCVRVSKYY